MFKVLITCSHNSRPIAVNITNFLKGNLGLDIEVGPDLSRGIGSGEYVSKALLAADHLFHLADIDTETLHDYGLYGIGLFMASKGANFITILSSEHYEIPIVLQDFHNYNSKESSIDQLKKHLFNLSTSNAASRSEEDVRDFLNRPYTRIELMGLLKSLPSGHPHTHVNSLTIDVMASDNNSSPSFNRVRLSDEASKMLDLLNKDQWTWKEIRESDQINSRCYDEIEAVIKRIVNGRAPKLIKNKIQSNDGAAYTPLLYSHERKSHYLYRFEMIFVQTTGEPIDEALVFVIIAYKAGMDEVFKTIESSAEDCNLRAQRVSDVLGDYKITDKIVELINRSRIVVADLTHERPNTYFELGYARGVGKTVITTVQKDTAVHFDVKDWAYIEYNDYADLKQKLEKNFISLLKHESK